MTIQQRIIEKQNEIDSVQSTQDRLWKQYKAKELELRENYQKPWNEAYKKLRALNQDLAVLLQVEKEIGL